MLHPLVLQPFFTGCLVSALSATICQRARSRHSVARSVRNGPNITPGCCTSGDVRSVRTGPHIAPACCIIHFSAPVVPYASSARVAAATLHYRPLDLLYYVPAHAERSDAIHPPTYLRDLPDPPSRSLRSPILALSCCLFSLRRPLPLPPNSLAECIPPL